MANDHNHISIIGRLTKDPETRQTSGGTTLCNFSIATNKSYTSNGEKKEEVSFFNCVAWGKLAEIVSKYCTKGKQILIGGSLHENRWKDAEGKNHSRVQITVETMQMLGSREKEGEKKEYAGPPQSSGDPFGYDEEDIPF